MKEKTPATSMTPVTRLWASRIGLIACPAWMRPTMRSETYSGRVNTRSGKPLSTTLRRVCTCVVSASASSGAL